MNMYGRKLTGQQKNVAVAIKRGNLNVPDAQGSSRSIYDSLPLDGTTLMRFFFNCQRRAFPMTNINESRLLQQESMIVKRIYFGVMTFDDVDPDLFISILPAINGGNSFVYGGQFSVVFDTTQVVKPYPMASLRGPFNKFSSYNENEVLTLDTEISLQQNLNFELDLELPSYTAVADSYLRCTMEGEGTIYRPDTQS